MTVLPSSVAPAIAPSYSRAGVVVNFVTATGGDVEMLRSIECFYKSVALLYHSSLSSVLNDAHSYRIKCVRISRVVVPSCY